MDKFQNPQLMAGFEAEAGCRICLEPRDDLGVLVAVPDICGHRFCPDCISTWVLAGHDTCPVCLDHFSFFRIHKAGPGPAIKLMSVVAKPVEGYDLVETTATALRELDIETGPEKDWMYCDECGDREGVGARVHCASCMECYHLTCLNPPLAGIPIDDWFCRRCRHPTYPLSNGW